MEQQIGFDFNEVLEQFKSGKNLTGKDGLLAPLIKQLTEADETVKYSVSK